MYTVYVEYVIGFGPILYLYQAVLATLYTINTPINTEFCLHEVLRTIVNWKNSLQQINAERNEFSRVCLI